MTHATYAHQAVAVIKQRVHHFQPQLGIILGSGLGGLADQIDSAVTIPYAEIPGFPGCGVEGHHGMLHLGTLKGLPVVCMQGRAHLYEGIGGEVIQTMIRALKLLGCRQLLLTNAAGSLRSEVGPGKLMLITDHINFLGTNPLVGKNDNDFGPRFVGMENAYDPALRQRVLDLALKLTIPLAQGVYLANIGPVFETPAEIKAYKLLGADAVGMSTVPETIVARHCGLQVVAISAITNFAVGLHKGQLSHEVTLQGAKLAAQDLTRLVLAFVESLN